MLFTIISFIIVLGILIFVHEFGHYIVAKAVGIRVEEFALGFGPKLISHTKGETAYSIRIVPLGGFCNMTGEFIPDEDMENEERKLYEETKEEGRCFHQQPLYQRFLVVVMGPAMNFLLAMLLFVFIFYGFAFPVLDSTELGSVESGLPAAEAGLRPGDKIESVDGNQVSNWTQIQGAISTVEPDSEINIYFNREGQRREVTLSPVEQDNYLIIGIGPRTSEGFSLFTSLKQGILTGSHLTVQIILAFGDLIKGGIGSEDVGGPVMIASLSGQAARQGLPDFMNFIALISINLGIINLFPIPALDGGRIFFMAIEAVRGKPIDPEKEGFVHLVGFVLLMVLMVFIVFLDLKRLF
ncbi:MAG: RIP metalloprotease RseP [Bacillota bacterium]